MKKVDNNRSIKTESNFEFKGLLGKEYIFYSVMGITSNKNLLIYILSVLLLFNLSIIFGSVNILRISSLLIYSPFIDIVLIIISFFLYYRSLKSLFKSSLNKEKPLLYLLFSIYGSRFSLDRTIHAISKSSISKYLKSSVKVLKYWLIHFYIEGDPIDEIISRYLYILPDEGLKKYFRDMIRVNWVGGDLSNYLKSSLKNLYSVLKENWYNAWRNIAGYLEVIIIVFGLFPSLLASMVFLLGQSLTITIFITILASYPFIAFITYLIIEGSNPRLPIQIEYKTYSFYDIIIIISLIVISYQLLLRLINLPNDVLIGWAITISFLPYFTRNTQRIKRASKLESELLSFLKELEELVKGGFSIMSALKSIDLSKYSNLLANIIRRFISSYELGLPKKEYLDIEYSDIVKFFKVAVFEIMYAGGGLEEIIELRDYINAYSEINRLRISSSIIPLATSIGVILLGGYSCWIIKDILSSININLLGFGPSFLGFISTLSIFSRLFIYAGAAYTGLILDKVVYGSFKNLVITYILIAFSTILLTLIPI